MTITEPVESRLTKLAKERTERFSFGDTLKFNQEEHTVIGRGITPGLEVPEDYRVIAISDLNTQFGGKIAGISVEITAQHSSFRVGLPSEAVRDDARYFPNTRITLVESNGEEVPIQEDATQVNAGSQQIVRIQVKEDPTIGFELFFPAGEPNNCIVRALTPSFGKGLPARRLEKMQ